MARIRSTHPGQWSDEDFVAMSFPARVLALALRNVADDHGVFEWKPLTIKMQLLPADNVDIAELLSEMVVNNIVVEFDVEGKRYGAIRNFMKWQRPKKPSYQYPCPEQVREYVGIKPDLCETDDASENDSSVPVGNQFGTGSEIAPQRKEVGGRKKEVRKKGGADAPADLAFSGRIIRVTGADLEKWRLAYPNVSDFTAELTKADDYYTEHPTKDGKWFFQVSKWLDRANKDAGKARSPSEAEIYPPEIYESLR